MEQIAGSLVVLFQVTSGDPDFVDSKKKSVAFYYEVHDSWLYLYICRFVDVWKMGQSVNG